MLGRYRTRLHGEAGLLRSCGVVDFGVDTGAPDYSGAGAEQLQPGEIGPGDPDVGDEAEAVVMKIIQPLLCGPDNNYVGVPIVVWECGVRCRPFYSIQTPPTR